MSMGLKLAVKKNKQASQDIEAVNARIRELTGHILVLEEKFEDEKKKSAIDGKKKKDALQEAEKKLKDASSTAAALTEAKRTADEAKKQADAEHKRTTQLQTILRGVQQEQALTLDQLKAANARIAQLEDQNANLQAALTAQEHSYQAKLSTLEAENEQWRKTQREASNTPEAQLNEQLQALSDSYVALQTEYLALSGQASKLQAENFELKQASSSSATDQNDMLNQRLLSHYRYLVTLTEDQDSPTDPANASTDDWT